MPDQLSKRERAVLRNLAAEAHEQELEDVLSDLYDKFCIWGGKGMNAFDLSELIHEFHDGVSRELYKTYVLGAPEISVAIGVSRGAIDPDDLDKKLYMKISPIVDSIEKHHENKDDEAT